LLRDGEIPFDIAFAKDSVERVQKRLILPSGWVDNHLDPFCHGEYRLYPASGNLRTFLSMWKVKVGLLLKFFTVYA